MNKKIMLGIMLCLNWLALIIDPVLAAIFLLMWPIWFKMNEDKFD